jgi:cytochrome c-type protein NapC
MSTPINNDSFIRRLWNLLTKPSHMALGALLAVGIVVGVMFWGSFNWSLELTNTEEFCISCHEMETNVWEEYRDTIHYSNRSGVRATCPDCHVPNEWVYKMMRKIQATNELWHKMLGTIDTREKFEDKRLELAMHEWIRMKETDSRECRNCHNYDYMDLSEQGRRSSRIHEEGFESGKTCIDCHKGVAHELPQMDLDKVNAELAQYGD